MRKAASCIACVCLLIAILLTAVDSVCFAKSFYQYEYTKGSQAEKIGMSDEGLMAATETLLDYLKDKRDDIVVETEVYGETREVYNERETMHMVDVKNLYARAMLARNLLACAGLAILCLLYIKNRNGYFAELKEGWIRALILLLLFTAFVGIWCAVDFNAFWLQFHYIFFDNDLFLLDPNTSIMINMFPSSFFFDIVLLIIGVFLLLAGLITFLLTYLKRKESAW